MEEPGRDNVESQKGKSVLRMILRTAADRLNDEQPRAILLETRRSNPTIWHLTADSSEKSEKFR